MKSVRIAFALSARGFDSDGFLYCKEVLCLKRAAELPQLLEGDLRRVAGGYVFIFDGMVWNAPKPTRFDPAHVRVPVDSLVFSAGLIADLATQVGQQSRMVCMLWEMASLCIELEAGSTAIIAAVDHMEKVIFPPETVNFPRLLRKLLRATDDFIGIAQEDLNARLDILSPQTASYEIVRVNQQFLDDWRESARQVRSYLADVGHTDRT